LVYQSVSEKKNLFRRVNISVRSRGHRVLKLEAFPRVGQRKEIAPLQSKHEGTHSQPISLFSETPTLRAPPLLSRGAKRGAEAPQPCKQSRSFLVKLRAISKSSVAGFLSACGRPVTAGPYAHGVLCIIHKGITIRMNSDDTRKAFFTGLQNLL